MDDLLKNLSPLFTLSTGTTTTTRRITIILDFRLEVNYTLSCRRERHITVGDSPGSTLISPRGCLTFRVHQTWPAGAGAPVVLNNNIIIIIIVVIIIIIGGR